MAALSMTADFTNAKQLLNSDSFSALSHITLSTYRTDSGQPHQISDS